MNNTSILSSLDDTTELRKLILKYPELPIVIFAGDESYTGEYNYNLADVSKVKVEEMTYDGEFYIEKSEYEDKLWDAVECEGDKDKEIDKIVQSTEFLKAIVIYVG